MISKFVEGLKARGFYMRVHGDRLRLDAPKGVLTPDTLGMLKSRKNEIMGYLQRDRRVPVKRHVRPDNEQARCIAIPEPGPGASDQLWRDWFEERAAIRQYDAGYSRLMAEHLAYGEAVNRWHRMHGGRTNPAHCPGCGELTSGSETLKLPDGNRVHVNENWRCLTAFGKRWRNAAVRALTGLGVVAPPSWGSD